MDRDGGKIGGVPSWLNPRDIPQVPIYCLDCPKRTNMRFITQLYCPLDATSNDNDNEEDQSFHPTLYVFACPYACHSKVDKTKNNTHQNCGGIRVLRCQLPQTNPFYPYDDGTHDSDDDSHRITPVSHLSTDGWDIFLCRVCGQRGKGNCPKQKLCFCGKECQKEHFKHIFHPTLNHDANNDDLIKTTTTTTHNTLHDSLEVCVPSRFKELELVVEEEPPPLSASTVSLYLPNYLPPLIPTQNHKKTIKANSKRSLIQR